MSQVSIVYMVFEYGTAAIALCDMRLIVVVADEPSFQRFIVTDVAAVLEAVSSAVRISPS